MVESKKSLNTMLYEGTVASAHGKIERENQAVIN